jgi:predicted acetyltransferase
MFGGASLTVPVASVLWADAAVEAIPSNGMTRIAAHVKSAKCFLLSVVCMFFFCLGICFMVTFRCRDEAALTYSYRNRNAEFLIISRFRVPGAGRKKGKVQFPELQLAWFGSMQLQAWK